MLVDRVQIQQVLLNLIRNAVEAMEGRAVRELAVATAASADHVLISVTDTGGGDPAGDQGASCSSPSSRPSRRHGHRAVDLPHIIEAHSGRLWAEPNPAAAARSVSLCRPVDPDQGKLAETSLRDGCGGRKAVQPDQDDADLELLELAEATTFLAEAVADAAIATRLREIAGELRGMRSRGGEWPGGRT